MSAVLMTGARFLIPIIAKRLAKRLGLNEKIALEAAEALAEPISEKIGYSETDVDRVSVDEVKAHIDAYIDNAPDIVRLMEIWAGATAADSRQGGLNALWRPINGLVFAIEMVILVVAGIVSAFMGTAGPFQQMVISLTPLLTAQAGFLGWYAHLRSLEKKRMV